MLYLKGQPRDQLVLYTTCLEEMIPPDNFVRLIDAFVVALDLEQLGFAPLPVQGRPLYHTESGARVTFYTARMPVCGFTRPFNEEFS